MDSPLALGLDLVDIQDFRDAMQRRGTRLLKRLFTERERLYCESQHDPALSYAARFAAKEATAKALGTGLGANASFLDIEVVPCERTRAPRLHLSGKAAETAASRRISRWLVSLSHTPTTAAASVIGMA